MAYLRAVTVAGRGGRRPQGDFSLGGLFKGVAKVAGAVLPGPVGAAVRLTTRVLTSRPQSGPGVGGFAGGGSVSGFGPALPATTQSGKPRKKYRRMNYGNAKAARRAIRRIKGTRKLLQDIERQLPRKTVRSRSHHHHHA